MNALFGTKYAGFIAGAYGVTFLVLLAMVIWVIVTARSRQKALSKLETEGIKRASRK